jgi:hypothetical protein
MAKAKYKPLFERYAERSMLIVAIPGANIRSLSAEEQNLFVTFGNAANELAALSRVVTICGHQEHPGYVHEAFVDSQYLTMLKLYAGKVYESWQLIRQRYFGSKLSKKYDSLLKPHAKADLELLKKYFSNGKNVIALLRNEGAFHYSRADIKHMLDDVTVARIYLAGRYFCNELYDFGDLAMTKHLFGQITEKPRDAVTIVNDDIASIGNMIHSFMKSVLLDLMVASVSHDGPSCTLMRFKMPKQRKQKTAAIPIFFDPFEYRSDFARFRKSLRSKLKRGRKSKRPIYEGYAQMQHLRSLSRLAKKPVRI